MTELSIPKSCASHRCMLCIGSSALEAKGEATGVFALWAERYHDPDSLLAFFERDWEGYGVLFIEDVERSSQVAECLLFVIKEGPAGIVREAAEKYAHGKAEQLKLVAMPVQ